MLWITDSLNLHKKILCREFFVGGVLVDNNSYGTSDRNASSFMNADSRNSTLSVGGYYQQIELNGKTVRYEIVLSYP